MVFVSVENKGAYRCLTAWRAGHSKIMCNSSATATLPQSAARLPAYTGKHEENCQHVGLLISCHVGVIENVSS